MDKYKNRKYSVEAHNPEWIKRFEIEAGVLKSIFGNVAISIEHIGSTAVFGLAAKPTIDILVIVNNLADVEFFVGKMLDAGYKDMGGYVTNDSKLFVMEKQGVRLSNVHIFPKDHVHVSEMLQVRDYLRTHPEKVKEYNDIKQRLYDKYPENYGMYRKCKDEWMKRLIGSYNGLLSIVKATPEDSMGIQKLTAEASRGMYNLCGWSNQDVLNHFTQEKIDNGAKKLSEAINFFTDSEILIVAKDFSGIVVGSCFAVTEKDRNRIEAMYVSPAYQGSGLAKRLFDVVYEKLDHNQDTYLDVFSLNIKGIKFYKKFGFLETGRKFFDKEYSNSDGSPLEITEMKLVA